MNYLPKHYKEVEQPFYEGKGNHNVSELEAICEQYKEYCHQQRILKSELYKQMSSMFATLKEADKEFTFHNWNNSTTGRRVQQEIIDFIQSDAWVFDFL